MAFPFALAFLVLILQGFCRINWLVEEQEVVSPQFFQTGIFQLSDAMLQEIQNELVLVQTLERKTKDAL